MLIYHRTDTPNIQQKPSSLVCCQFLGASAQMLRHLAWFGCCFSVRKAPELLISSIGAGQRMAVLRASKWLETQGAKIQEQLGCKLQPFFHWWFSIFMYFSLFFQYFQRILGMIQCILILPFFKWQVTNHQILGRRNHQIRGFTWRISSLVNGLSVGPAVCRAPVPRGFARCCVSPKKPLELERSHVAWMGLVSLECFYQQCSKVEWKLEPTWAMFFIFFIF